MVEKQKKRRWPKRLAIGIGILLLLTVAAFSILQTPWAKRKIADVLARTLGEKLRSQVTIGRLTGILPFRIDADVISFQADGRTWLHIEDARVKPAVYSILRGKTHIYDLSAESVLLEGKPPESEKKEPKPWRESIPALTIDRLYIEAFTIGEAIAGERATFRVEGEMLAVDPAEKAHVLLEAERTDGRKGIVSLSVDLSDRLDLKANVDEGENGIVGRLLGVEKPGTLAVSIDGEGPLNSWALKLSATLDGFGNAAADIKAKIDDGPFSLSQPNPELDGKLALSLEHETGTFNASGNVQLLPGMFRAEEISGSGAGSSFTGYLDYDLSSKLVNGKLDGSFEDLSVPGRLIGRDLKGSARFSAAMDSQNGEQNADIRLSGSDIRGEFGSAGTLELSGRLRDAFGEFVAKGTMKVHSYQKGDIRVEDLAADIEGDADKLNFKGDISGYLREPFKLSLSGLLSKRQLLRLDTLDATYGEIPVELLEPTTLEIAGNSYSLSTTPLKINGGSFTASGSYGGSGVSAEVDFQDVPAMMLHRAGTPELSGTASGSVRMSGSLKEPNLRATIDLVDMKPTDPTCREIPQVTVHAEGGFDAGVLTAKLTATGEAGVLVEGDCRLPVALSLDPFSITLVREGELAGNLKANTQIDEIVALLLPEGHCISGKLDLDVHASGSMGSPVMTGTVNINEGGYSIAASDRSFSGLGLDTAFSMKDRQFTLSRLDLTSDQGTVTGNASVQTGEWPWEISRESAISGKLDIDGEIGKYIQMVLPEDTLLAGKVNANLDLAGTLKNPSLEGHIDIANGSYASGRTGKVDITAKADVVMKDGSLSLANVQASAVDMNLSGDIEFTGGSGLPTFDADTTIKGRIKASGQIYQAAEIILGEDRDLHADIDADVGIAGRLGKVDTSGTILVKNGEYVEIDRGTVLKNIDAEIVPQGFRLVLKKLDATDGETGKVTATGWFDLDPSKSFPFEIKAKADKATLVRTDEVRASANAYVTVAGNVKDFLVSGKIETVSAQIRLPENQVPQLGTLDIVEIDKEGKIIKPVEQEKKTELTMRLDLEVNIPSRAFVKGYGLDSEWEGNLKLKGAFENMQIAGELTVTRGNFQFVTKRLDLTRGKIYFSGGNPPRPMLDLTAETTAGDITAYIKLSGFLNAPDISFSSSPVLPQDEILARILFGKTWQN